jgi:tripartite-type tricarboxylate transporter receptor subunit TctC
MLSNIVHAQSDRPITIVAAFPAGGGADVIARMLAPKLSVALERPVVVDNKAGASGNLAADFVARATPDGNTLLMHNNTLTINATIRGKSVDPKRDLAPLAAVASTPIVIAVNPSIPVKTLAEFIEWGKAHPDKLNYSSCGNGTAQHFAGVQFAQITGLKLVHIPYKGCAPAVIDGVGGTVPILFNTIPNLDAQVQAGKLRFLAVATPKRLAIRPDVPTFAETRGMEKFIAEVWFGFFAPPATPKPVLARIEKALLTLMEQKEIQQEFDNRQMARISLDSKQFAKQIDEDLVSWKRLAEEFRIVPD